MLSFFGGVSEYIVPDNLKSGVTSPDYYDPQINILYTEMAEHYDVAILPARPIKPKDKAKARERCAECSKTYIGQTEKQNIL